MKTQREIIRQLSELAGGIGKLANLIDKPVSRVSEWHTGTHAMTLPTLLLMLEKLDLDISFIKNDYK